jgi:hypothetical protein
MPSALFFMRCFYLIALILLHTCLWAQNVLVCTSCSEEVIRSINKTSSIQIFKCKITSSHLPALYKWGIVDSKGYAIVNPVWDSIGTVSKNYAEVYQYVPQRKKTTLKAGLISWEGKMVLPLQYASVQLLKDPYYKINTGKGFQVWHAEKGFVSKQTYERITIDTLGILLYTDNICHRINPSTGILEEGNFKLWLMADHGRVYSIPYDTLYIYRAGQIGLTALLADSIGNGKHAQQVNMYREGKSLTWNFSTAVPAPHTTKKKDVSFVDLDVLDDSTLIKIKNRTQADVILLINPLFLFKRNNFWGYGDTIGNVTIAAVYDSLGMIYNDRVAVRMNNKWGFLDGHENIIAQPYYEEVGDYRYGATWVRQQKKYNFLDLSGKVINTHWYDKIEETQRNYIVYYKGKAGLVNHLGQEIIGTRYLQILDFGEGACLVQTEDQKWYVMDYKVYYLAPSKTYVLKK